MNLRVLVRVPMPRAGAALACTAALTALGLLTLAGCGSTPTAPKPTAPATTRLEAAAPDPWLRSLADFELRQRATAHAAAAQGRWADAITALDVLTALRPDDAALAQQAVRARSSADSVAREKLQRGKQAAQRGDSEAAVRAFLDTLALAPGLIEAADGLRSIERERVRRQHLGKPSRYAMGSPAAALQVEPPALAIWNELEQASLLVDQSEFGAAVAGLTPLAQKRGADSSVVRLLADIRLRHAESMGNTDKAADKAAVRTALERGLKLERGHVPARAMLDRLNLRQ